MHFGSILLLFGGFVFLVWVARPTFREAGPAARDMAVALHRWLLNVAGISVLVALVSGAWWLGIESVQMSGLSWQEAWQRGMPGVVVDETRFGQVWQFRLGIAVALGLVIAWSRREAGRTGPAAAGGLLAGLLLATLALVGHAAAPAASAEDLRGAADAIRMLASVAWIGHAAATAATTAEIGMAADAVHLLAAGAWVGSLPALVYLLNRSGPATVSLSVAEAAARRLSTLAIISVICLVVSGLISSWHLVGGLPGLLGTLYGRLLMLKLGLFALMLALAAANRLRWTPMLAPDVTTLNATHSQTALRKLKRNAIRETLLGGAIVSIVGALGTIRPGAHEQPVWPLPFALGWPRMSDLGGLHVTFALGGIVAAGLAIFFARRLGIGKLFAGAIGTGVALAVPVWLAAEPAYPTSFFHSPVRYTATSVARGNALYIQNCASCHGPDGYGDGRAAEGSPVEPVDLTRDLLRHREGDLFWWLSNGVAGTSMPGFSTTIGETGRWDIVNFLHAQAEAERAKEMTGGVDPWQGIVAPDFTFETESGVQETLLRQRGRSNVLLILFTYPDSISRLCALAASQATLERAGVRLIAIPMNREAMITVPGERADRQCLQSSIAYAPDFDIVAAYTLFRRVPPRSVPPVAAHSEFLIDRQGYLRARWTAQRGETWDGHEDLLRQIRAMDRQGMHPPAGERRSH